MNGLLRLLVICAVVVLAGCGAFNRITGKGKIKEEPPAKLQQIDVETPVTVQRNWSYNVGPVPEHSSQLMPARLGDTLFAASPTGLVSAVDPATGRSKWRRKLDMTISGAVGVAGDLVLLGSLDGTIVALKADGGDEVWRQQLSSEILAPAAGDGGTVAVRTSDGRVYGLSTIDGTQKWVIRRQVPSLTLRGNSPPLVVQGAVLAGFASGKVVAAQLSDGSIIWDISVAEPRGRNEVERMIDIDAAPVLVGSVLYVSAYQGSVTALALGSRRVLWSQEISSYEPIGADDENIYVADEHGVVRALDRLTGQTLWEQAELVRRRLSGPISLGNYVLVSDFEGYVHVLRKTDGKIVGRRKLGTLAGIPLVTRDSAFSMTEGGSLVSITLRQES